MTMRRLTSNYRRLVSMLFFRLRSPKLHHAPILFLLSLLSCQSLLCFALRFNLLVNDQAQVPSQSAHRHHHAVGQHHSQEEGLMWRDAGDQKAIGKDTLHNLELISAVRVHRQVAKESVFMEREVECGDKPTQRMLSSVGSAPPVCVRKCSTCIPCQPIRAPVQPGRTKVGLMEYYPEAWRCKCKNKLYMP